MCVRVCVCACVCVCVLPCSFCVRISILGHGCSGLLPTSCPSAGNREGQGRVERESQRDAIVPAVPGLVVGSRRGVVFFMVFIEILLRAVGPKCSRPEPVLYLRIADDVILFCMPSLVSGMLGTATSSRICSHDQLHRVPCRILHASFKKQVSSEVRVCVSVCVNK